MGGFTSTTSAHTEAYGDLGWNMIPAFINSPQFFRRAISKSNLLLAVTCLLCWLCSVAASLHSCCAFLSREKEKVALSPTLIF